MTTHANESDVLSDPAELVRLLDLPSRLASDALASAADYPMALPRTLLDRIKPNDANDPILLQFLPRSEELSAAPGFSADPLAESDQSGPILRKYEGRALLLTGGGCAANCRFCFRRHLRRGGLFDSEAGSCAEERRRLETLLRPLAEDASVREVILSGSDPLGLAPDRLSILLNYIKSLPFVNRVRIHTRRPILLPQEADEPFFSLWRPEEWPGKRLVFVFHINHRAELNRSVETFFHRMAAMEIPLLAQTVLLRGVNDRADVLAELFEKLGNCAVLPYYLHQLDRVAGAAHFEVEPARGREIVRELRRRLPGYLVPRYVREIPREAAKIPMEG